MYDTIFPSISVLPEPSRITVANSNTVWSGPASAVGREFTFFTVTSTSSVAISPKSSVTCKLNLSTISSGPTSGATNVGFTSVVEESSTWGSDT